MTGRAAESSGEIFCTSTIVTEYPAASSAAFVAKVFPTPGAPCKKNADLGLARINFAAVSMETFVLDKIIIKVPVEGLKNRKFVSMVELYHRKSTVANRISRLRCGEAKVLWVHRIQVSFS
jgi:hypothetical protein